MVLGSQLAHPLWPKDIGARENGRIYVRAERIIVHILREGHRLGYNKLRAIYILYIARVMDDWAYFAGIAAS